MCLSCQWILFWLFYSFVFLSLRPICVIARQWTVQFRTWKAQFLYLNSLTDFLSWWRFPVIIETKSQSAEGKHKSGANLSPRQSPLKKPCLLLPLAKATWVGRCWHITGWEADEWTFPELREGWICMGNVSHSDLLILSVLLLLLLRAVLNSIRVSLWTV